jgi:myo-inositol-1(or 4)-monophosphatase
MTDALGEDTALLVRATKEAGAIARSYFGGTYKSWTKGKGNPVTEADIAVDRFLKRVLLAARPAYGWLSEESPDDLTRLRTPRVLVVDPIDGTYGFVKGRPQFTIVAAVVAAGRPVSAAIYNPMTDEMFEATAGEGARLNGRPIHVSAKADFDGAKLLASRPLIACGRWSTPWPESLLVNTRASVAYRMALVAAGEYDAMISLTAKSDWDVAAADLVVSEAGGMVTTDRNQPLVYNRRVPQQQSVICAGPALHEKLLERLKELAPFQ